MRKCLYENEEKGFNIFYTWTWRRRLAVHKSQGCFDLKGRSHKIKIFGWVDLCLERCRRGFLIILVALSIFN
jgi:hypothetical protein